MRDVGGVAKLTVDCCCWLLLYVFLFVVLVGLCTAVAIFYGFYHGVLLTTWI